MFINVSPSPLQPVRPSILGGTLPLFSQAASHFLLERNKLILSKFGLPQIPLISTALHVPDLESNENVLYPSFVCRKQFSDAPERFNNVFLFFLLSQQPCISPSRFFAFPFVPINGLNQVESSLVYSIWYFIFNPNLSHWLVFSLNCLKNIVFSFSDFWLATARPRNHIIYGSRHIFDYANCHVDQLP